MPRILVVDPYAEDTHASYYERLKTIHGVEVVVETLSKKGLVRLEAGERFHIVLVDALQVDHEWRVGDSFWPDVWGYQLYKRLRKTYPDLSLIVQEYTNNPCEDRPHVKECGIMEDRHAWLCSYKQLIFPSEFVAELSRRFLNQ